MICFSATWPSTLAPASSRHRHCADLPRFNTFVLNSLHLVTPLDPRFYTVTLCVLTYIKADSGTSDRTQNDYRRFYVFKLIFKGLSYVYYRQLSYNLYALKGSDSRAADIFVGQLFCSVLPSATIILLPFCACFLYIKVEFPSVALVLYLKFPRSIPKINRNTSQTAIDIFPLVLPVDTGETTFLLLRTDEGKQ